MFGWCVAVIWVLSAGGVCMVFLLCWFVYRWFCCGYRLVAYGCFLVLLAVVGLACVVLGLVLMVHYLVDVCL